MVLASDNLTYQPPYIPITRDYDRNRSITAQLVIRRPVLTLLSLSCSFGAFRFRVLR
jgi:hypothetical protein